MTIPSHVVQFSSLGSPQKVIPDDASFWIPCLNRLSSPNFWSRHRFVTSCREGQGASVWQGGQPGELATSSDIESLVKNLNLDIHDRITIWRLGPYVPNGPLWLNNSWKVSLPSTGAQFFVPPPLWWGATSLIHCGCPEEAIGKRNHLLKTWKNDERSTNRD